MPPSFLKSELKRKAEQIVRDIRKRRKSPVQQHPIVGETNRFDIIGNLPPELVQTIFAQLNPSDLCSAVKTSKKWKDLADNDYFWKHKCQMDNYLEADETSQNKVYEKFVHKSANYWERVYMYNEALHQNWLDYEFKETIFDFPRGDPLLHYFDDEILIMTNDSKRIFVYNYSAEKFLQVFPIRSNFYNVGMIRKTLNFVVYFRSPERLLIVWCINTGTCKLNIHLADESSIREVIIDKHLVAVLFHSGNCQIVNILSEKVEHITSFEDLNHCVCFHEGQVAFGTRTGVINIMNWSDKMITTTLIYGADIIVYKIMISGDYLISFSTNDICVWSLEKKTKLNVIVRSDQSISHQYAVLSNSTLFAFNLIEDTLEAWDFIAGTRKFSIKFEGAVKKSSTLMNDHYIFTFTIPKFDEPAKMTVWCKKTGYLLSNVSFNCRIVNPRVTNTKFTYLNSSYSPSMHIQDFGKKIKLRQLNSLYT